MYATRRAVAPLAKTALRRKQQQHQPRLRQASRRMFHDDGLPHSLQPQFAPGEELALDATAWFVAFALVWAPLHEFDDLDYESMNEMQDQANSRKGHKDQVQKQNEKDQQPKDHEGKH